MNYPIVGQQTTDRDQLALELDQREWVIAVETVSKRNKEDNRFSKGLLHNIKSKINILCDADRDIPARYRVTIEQIERAML